MTFAGMVVMIAAALVCSKTSCSSAMSRYEIAAGAVPLAFGLVFVVLDVIGLYIHHIVKIVFASILLGWWIAAFTVLTFFGSFRTPVWGFSFYANGFFFSWVGLIASALAFAESLKECAMKSEPPNPAIPKSGFLFVVIIGSTIELGAAIHWFYRLAATTSLTIYALSLGSVSIFLVLVIYFVLICTRRNYDIHDSMHNAGLYMLTLWWAVGTLVLTFDGFWVQALDNGYFSVIFTLGACLLALSGIWEDEPVEERDRRPLTQ